MMSEQQPKTRFVPHKTLKEGWSYVSVMDGQYVLGIKVAIAKVGVLVGPDGKDVMTPAGPAFNTMQAFVTRILTREEWDMLKKEGDVD